MVECKEYNWDCWECKKNIKKPNYDILWFAGDISIGNRDLFSGDVPFCSVNCLIKFIKKLVGE